MSNTLSDIFKDIANAIRTKSGVSTMFTPNQMADEIVNIPSGANLGVKTITKNGMFQASADGFDGFSSVNVNVPSSGTSILSFRASDSIVNQFNFPVKLEGGYNCSNMFYNFYNFNQSVNIPSEVTNCANMFYNCRNYNNPINIPDEVMNCSRMFYGCKSFNHSVNIPNSIKSCESMFYNCRNYNSVITFLENGYNINCYCMFQDCITFNQPILITNGIRNCMAMFSNCQAFNQAIDIPQSVEVMGEMFSNCQNFNCAINLPNNITNCNYRGMFSNCRNFNQPVIFGNISMDISFNSIANYEDAFENCIELNSPISIGYSGGQNVRMSRMFYNCTKFNSIVEMPSGSETANYSCDSMFYNCIEFNQPISLPDRLYIAQSMFYNCKNFNQPIRIGGRITNCTYMFRGATNMSSDIIFDGSAPSNLCGMLAERSNANRIRVFCNNISGINGSGTWASNCLVANTITWTPEGNGYFNAYYNIYISNKREYD